MQQGGIDRPGGIYLEVGRHGKEKMVQRRGSSLGEFCYRGSEEREIDYASDQSESGKSETYRATVARQSRLLSLVKEKQANGRGMQHQGIDTAGWNQQQYVGWEIS